MALKGSTNSTRTRSTAPAAPAQPVTTDPQTARTLRVSDPHSLALQALPAKGLQITEQHFSTGSMGYRFNGKAVDADGVRYQATIMLVRIGTKPQS